MPANAWCISQYVRIASCSESCSSVSRKSIG
jgi:hypothetical protein